MASDLDLNQFPLDPYLANHCLIFSPKDEDEGNRLGRLLEVDKLALILVKEGAQLSEQEGLDPDQPAQWTKIFELTGLHEGCSFKLKTERGESVHVLLSILRKQGRYRMVWTAYLCTDTGAQYLETTQQDYANEVRTHLECGPTPRLGWLKLSSALSIF